MVNLMEKLEALAARYDELQTRLSQPETVADMDNFRRLMKEHADMEELMAAYREYRATADNLAGAREMLEDADLREMAKEEIAQLEPRKEELEKRLQLLLLPKDPNDERNVILEIRAGTGGEEAALFASELARMYGHYADARGWRCEELDANLTELGGVKELSLRIEGQGAYSRLKYESGAHRVQRVPETESGGRIHTSAATVAVMPEVDDVEVEINPNDLRIDTYRAGGAGGQHVNRTDSAVRMTHIPTGIVAQCQNERSQVQNREVCLRILKSRLLELREREKEEQMADIKGEMKKIEWGSQIRSYVFQPYTMVKDHRTGYESGNVDDVMDGNLDGFITAYLKMQ